MIRKWIMFPVTVIKVIGHILQFYELLPIMQKMIMN